MSRDASGCSEQVCSLHPAGYKWPPRTTPSSGSAVTGLSVKNLHGSGGSAEPVPWGFTNCPAISQYEKASPLRLLIILVFRDLSSPQNKIGLPKSRKDVDGGQMRKVSHYLLGKPWKRQNRGGLGYGARAMSSQ